MNITKPGQNAHLKALIFGPYGSGKTHFLGTAQEDERTAPALYMDFEGGGQTLAGLDIDQVVVRTWQDFNEIYAELSAGTKYQTILLDSLSETHIFALMEILSEVANSRDPDKLEIQDYGKASIQMRRVIRAFRDLPYHFIATSQDKTDREARVGNVKKPALAGQMADEAPGLFDVCGDRTIATETLPDKTTRDVHSLLLKNFAQFRVKTRTPWGQEDTVPDYIDDPNVGSLLDVLGFVKKEEVQPQEDNVVPLATTATRTSRRKSS
jgi:AAA domain-containing protein